MDKKKKARTDEIVVRLAQNKRYAGKYVALGPPNLKIIASSSRSEADALRRARQKGVSEPITMRVPLPDEEFAYPGKT